MFIAVRRVAFAVAVAATPQALAFPDDGDTEQITLTPVLIPAAGAVDVPTNARLFLRDAGGITTEELDAAVFFGAEGDVALTRNELNQFVVLTPVAELVPQTTYTLTIGDKLTSSFTTGSGADNDPPAPPTLEVTSAEGTVDDVFGTVAGYIAVDVTSELFTVVARDAPVQIDASLQGPFYDVVLGPATEEAGFLQSNNEDSVEVHAVAIDIAGNISEPAVLTEDFPPATGCGCSQTQHPAPLAALAACATLMFHRRQRTSGT